MLRELLAIFRSDQPLARMGENFAEMLRLTLEMTMKAGELYFADAVKPDEQTEIYKTDVGVNKLERTIRKQVIAHLSLHGTSSSLPYCLLLMSLVKDVERIGDYAKNLAEVKEYHPDPLPHGDALAQLREIRASVEASFAETAEVFATSDRERALAMTREGRELTHRCDALVEQVARSDYQARTAVALALGARFYKRTAGHVLNVLSSVVMPLHKLDYYDEKEIDRDADEDDSD
ncbi:MAG: PhoU domain-containing protein [Gemmatimonadales bacterium]|jgi:phosphate uptake regulator